MTYVVANMHGAMEKYTALLEKIGFSDRDVLYVLGDIVATVTKIDGMDYRTCTSTLSDDDKSLKRVAEGKLFGWRRK